MPFFAVFADLIKWEVKNITYESFNDQNGPGQISTRAEKFLPQSPFPARRFHSIPDTGPKGFPVPKSMDLRHFFVNLENIKHFFVFIGYFQFEVAQIRGVLHF